MTTELTKAAPNNHGPIHETDLYDFAGWLTTRPGVMAVGSSCEAGPMAEAVGEYIKTFPERFAALTQRPAALQPGASNEATTQAQDDSSGDAQVDQGRVRDADSRVGSTVPELTQRPAAQDDFAHVGYNNRRAQATIDAMRQVDPVRQPAHQQATPASAPQSLLMRLAGIAAECSDPDTTDALDQLIAATPASQEQAKWTDADSDAARLALELECLLLDTKDTAAASRWWSSALEALELHRARINASQEQAAFSEALRSTIERSKAAPIGVAVEIDPLVSAEFRKAVRGEPSRFDRLLSQEQAQQATPEPVPMVLHCPKCGIQHIDAPEEHWNRQFLYSWENPPHRSHLCHGCGTIWRPADVPTTGVKVISTKGKADTWEPGQAATPEPVGEPAAWRWFNSNGDQVTNWLDFKAAQKANVEAQVAEAGGRIEYAYTRPAPGVPEEARRQLLEAWDYGQFADDANWAQAQPVRAAIHKLCEWLAAAQAKGGE